MSRYLCPECGRPANLDIDYDAQKRRALVALMPHEDCNPRLLRFFNSESQHFPPFNR